MIHLYIKGIPLLIEYRQTYTLRSLACTNNYLFAKQLQFIERVGAESNGDWFVYNNHSMLIKGIIVFTSTLLLYIIRFLS